MFPATVLASRLLVRARLRHLQVLLKVAELGSIKQAAEAVGLTQPSTTHIVADLEALLECRLFDRHARGMRPTRVTNALLPIVRRVLDAVAECAEVASALSANANGIVRVAAISGAVNGVLARLLPQFTKRHRDILVEVVEGDIGQIGGWIADDAVDLVLCREPGVEPAGWRFTPLVRDEFVVVCNTSHPCARRGPLALQDLWQETWLLSVLSSAPRRVFDELTASAGVRPPMRLVSSRSLAILLEMLRAEPLLSLMPLSIVSQLLETGQLTRLDVQVPVAFEPIGLMEPEAGMGAASQAFGAFVMKSASLRA